MNRILYLLILFSISFAYSKTIYGEYTYSYSDAETLIDAKQICQTLAKRDAVEKFATFIRSETVVRNYITEKDEVIANAEAMMTDVRIVEENIDRLNTTIYYKISAEVDEQKILGVYEEKERMRLEQAEAEHKAQELRLEAERKLQEEKLEADRKALADKLEHERKLAEINYKTKEIESSMLINQKDKRYWSTQKWIALGAFAGSAVLGTYFNSEGTSFKDESDAYYDDYLKATSTSTALNLYDQAVNSANKSDDFYNYRNVTFSVSLVPLGYFFYAWYKESQY
ncbi:MAG: hypothetical protein PHR06_14985 [Candidatus Cloacimonetes bacterium]|nr:hypothetical protein [Candidatus Cloacimonadota bacterium]